MEGSCSGWEGLLGKEGGCGMQDRGAFGGVVFEYGRRCKWMRE